MATRLRGRAGIAQRKRRLTAEPTCRICRSKGIIVAATRVDHIVALVNGGTDDDSNVQSLCEPCHEAKTRVDLGQRQQVAIGLDGWPLP